MDKNTGQKITLGVLCLIVVLVWVRGCSSSRPPGGQDDSTGSSGDPAFPTGEIARLTALILAEDRPDDRAKTTYTQWGRNPFVQGAAQTESPALTIEGITWDEKNPIAVISGEIYNVGDSLGANTIVEIQRDRVILGDGENTFELRLKK
jgi:hypothetical protein